MHDRTVVDYISVRYELNSHRCRHGVSQLYSGLAAWSPSASIIDGTATEASRTSITLKDRRDWPVIVRHEDAMRGGTRAATVRIKPRA